MYRDNLLTTSIPGDIVSLLVGNTASATTAAVAVSLLHTVENK